MTTKERKASTMPTAESIAADLRAAALEMEIEARRLKAVARILAPTRRGPRTKSK